MIVPVSSATLSVIDDFKEVLELATSAAAAAADGDVLMCLFGALVAVIDGGGATMAKP